MEPKQKLQKISHRQKITITAFPLKTDAGIQNVYTCSVCKRLFETVALATAHIAEHKKSRVKDHAGDSGMSHNMDTASSDTVQRESQSPHPISKRKLDGSFKQDDCLQVGLESECIDVGNAAIDKTGSVLQSANGEDGTVCDVDKPEFLSTCTSLSNAKTNFDYAAPCSSEKLDVFIPNPMSKQNGVNSQVDGNSDRCNDTDDATEDETNVSNTKMSCSDTSDGTSVPFPKIEQDGCQINSAKIDNCSVVLERLENTTEGQTFLKSCHDESNTPKCFVCSQCSLTFSKIWCYANHLLIYHCPLYRNKNILSCPICPCLKNTYSSYYDSLKIHLVRYHNLSEMKCLKCEEMFDTCSSLFTHIADCKADIPHNVMDIVCSHCNVYHILLKDNNSHKDMKEIINDILECMPKEEAADKMRKHASIITENVARLSAQPTYRCRECTVTFSKFSCWANHIAEEHAEKKLFNNKAGLATRPIACGKLSCKKQHVLSHRDVKVCRSLLEDAGVLTRDMRSGGTERVDELAANVHSAGNKTNKTSSHIKPNNSRKDIESQRLQCLMKYIDFDKLLYYVHYPKVLDINKFDLLSACTKEEIAKDMVHRIEHTDQGYECAICLDRFEEYGCCKSHVLTIHSAHFLYTRGSEVFTCPVCSISYHNIYRFEQHLEFHGVFKYCCKKCNLLFNNSSIYQTHLKHAKPEILTNKSYSCTSCGLIHNCVVVEGEQELIKYNNNPKRSKHSKKKSNSNSHFNNAARWRIRGVPYNRQNDIYGRIGFNGESYVCLECKKTYYDFNCCSSHVVIQHVNVPMMCLICNQRFGHRGSLNSHLKTDHQIEGFLYCTGCFESYISENDLTRHCQQCTDKRSSKNLEDRLCKTCCQLHVDVGIRMSNVNNCHQCQNGFTKLACYRNHYYREHFHCQLVLLSKYCRFQCSCGRHFLKLNNLYKHIHEIHSNTKVGMASQNTGILPQIDLPLPEESIDSDFDVQFKERKQECKSENTTCSGIKSRLNQCMHCNALHVTQSREIKMGSSSSKKHCEVCKVKFKNAKCLKNHMAVDHVGKKTVCQCVACGKWFSSLKLLELHQGRTEQCVVDTELHQGRTEQSVVDTELHQGRTEQSVVDTEDLQPESSTQSVTENPGEDNDTERIIPTVGIPMYITGKDESKAHKQSSVCVEGSEKDEQVNSSCAGNTELKCVDCCTVHVNKFDEAEKEIITGNIFDAIEFKVEKKQMTKSLYLESSCCPVCGKDCGSMSDLYDHIMEVHMTIKFTQGEITNISKEAYSCSYCPEKFRCSMDGQLHARSYHFEKTLVIIRNKENDDPIKAMLLMCPVCFITSYGPVVSIQKHLKSHFKSVTIYVCDACGKSFSRDLTLKQHISAKHSDQPTQYKCSVCGKCFKYQPNLDCHKKSHMEKKEACTICDMKFTLPAHVRQHMKSKH